MLCCLAQFVFVLCCWFAQLSYLTSLVFYPSWDRFDYITKVQPLKLATFSSLIPSVECLDYVKARHPLFHVAAHFARGSLCGAWIIQYPPPPHHPPPPGPVPFVIFTPRTHPHSAQSFPLPRLCGITMNRLRETRVSRTNIYSFLFRQEPNVSIKKVFIILYVPPESLCQGRLCWQ